MLRLLHYQIADQYQAVLMSIPARWRSTVGAASAALDSCSETASPRWEDAKPFDCVPGPRPLPLVGNAWRFLPKIGEYGSMDIADVLKSFNDSYGPVAKLSAMPGKPDTLIISDPTLIEQVLRNDGPWPVRKNIDSMEHYFRDKRKCCHVSLGASQGMDWQEFRTAVNQVMLPPKNLTQYIEPIDSVSHQFIDRIRFLRDDQLQMPDDFTTEIFHWALESVAYLGFDTRLGLLQGDPDANSEGSKLVAAVHSMFDNIYKLDFRPSLWKFVSTPAYRRLITTMEFFTEISLKYVNQALERQKGVPLAEIQDRKYSVLENILLQSKDPSKAVAFGMDMLLAGIDTTGTVVSTVLYQLATHPEKQRRLQEELDRVMGDTSKPLTKEDLEEMRYLRACIKETMRVMPILMANNRDTGKKMVLFGYQIPEGTPVIMAYRGIHNNEKFFPRAMEFLPERWMPGGEHLKCKHPFAFLPFGFGARMCVGKRLADIEMETLLARIFRNFSLEWNQAPAATRFRVLLQFVDPLKFTVKDRV